MPLLLLAVFAFAGYFALGKIMEDKTPNDGLTQAQFKARFHAAFTRAVTRNIPERLALTVSAHETGWGKGRGFRHSNNLFSIHVGAFLGRATPYWNGLNAYLTSNKENLRVYKNWEDSISDFSLGLATRPYLQKAYAHAVAGNDGSFFQAMQDSGYAEDSLYAIKLSGVYRTV